MTQQSTSHPMNRAFKARSGGAPTNPRLKELYDLPLRTPEYVMMPEFCNAAGPDAMAEGALHAVQQLTRVVGKEKDNRGKEKIDHTYRSPGAGDVTFDDDVADNEDKLGEEEAGESQDVGGVLITNDIVATAYETPDEIIPRLYLSGEHPNHTVRDHNLALGITLVVKCNARVGCHPYMLYSHKDNVGHISKHCSGSKNSNSNANSDSGGGSGSGHQSKSAELSGLGMLPPYQGIRAEATRGYRYFKLTRDEFYRHVESAMKVFEGPDQEGNPSPALTEVKHVTPSSSAQSTQQESDEVLLGDAAVPIPAGGDSSFAATTGGATVPAGQVLVFNIGADDDPSFDLSPFFFEAAVLLEKVLFSRSGAALVHCMAGVSRSTTTLCAFLMKHCASDRDDTLSLVRDRRKWAHPNSGFMNQLRLWEMCGYVRLGSAANVKPVAEHLTTCSPLQALSKMKCLFASLLTSASCERDRPFFSQVAKHAAQLGPLTAADIRRCCAQEMERRLDAMDYLDAPRLYSRWMLLTVDLEFPQPTFDGVDTTVSSEIDSGDVPKPLPVVFPLEFQARAYSLFFPSPPSASSTEGKKDDDDADSTSERWEIPAREALKFSACLYGYLRAAAERDLYPVLHSTQGGVVSSRTMADPMSIVAPTPSSFMLLPFLSSHCRTLQSLQEEGLIPPRSYTQGRVSQEVPLDHETLLSHIFAALSNSDFTLQNSLRGFDLSTAFTTATSTATQPQGDVSAAATAGGTLENSGLVPGTPAYAVANTSTGGYSASAMTPHLTQMSMTPAPRGTQVNRQFEHLFVGTCEVQVFKLLALIQYPHLASRSVAPVDQDDDGEVGGTSLILASPTPGSIVAIGGDMEDPGASSEALTQFVRRLFECEAAATNATATGSTQEDGGPRRTLFGATDSQASTSQKKSSPTTAGAPDPATNPLNDAKAASPATIVDRSKRPRDGEQAQEASQGGDQQQDELGVEDDTMPSYLPMDGRVTELDRVTAACYSYLATLIVAQGTGLGAEGGEQGITRLTGETEEALANMVPVIMNLLLRGGGSETCRSRVAALVTSLDSVTGLKISTLMFTKRK